MKKQIDLSNKTEQILLATQTPNLDSYIFYLLYFKIKTALKKIIILQKIKNQIT
jgi:hypothetical protein